ncbi:unnamed protein product [Euphydryas editha]|uniref:Uncharacterized protein n=1 Tax=Euphydryas editha TaxID=104508 RepID=A0AAU9UL12_EUPED|nr:unnamed protein product [Euphydryas editha]
MDQLTKFLVYNKTYKKVPNQMEDEIDKSLLLLSPDLGRMSEVKKLIVELVLVIFYNQVITAEFLNPNLEMLSTILL